MDNATFLADITLPDGAVVAPNQSLTKTWRMRNTGSSTWGSGYQLVFIGGAQMGAPGAVDIPAAAPGQEVDISVSLTTPASEGDYTGSWQLRNPQGGYFGDKIYVSLTVENDAPPPDPNSFTLTCLNCPATVEPGARFWPIVRATIGSGQLLEGRGDMLRNTDGNLFEAFDHVGVEGVVNTGQTYDLAFYAEHPIIAPTSEGVYESKWRLWQDSQYVGPELTIHFEVKVGGDTNYPPRAPSPVDPGDWAVFNGTTPTLKAQHNGDPDDDAITAYYFEIFESHDIPSSGWIASNSWTPPGLGNYGYQWRVKVMDSEGAESEWSEVRHFNILNPEPVIYDFHWEWCRDAWGGPEKVCFCAQTSGGGLNLKLNSANDGSDSGTWKGIGDADTNINCQYDTDNPVNWGQLEAQAGSYRVRLYQRPNVGGWDAANTADIVVTLPPDQRPGSPEIQFPQHGSYQPSQAVHFQWKLTYRTTDYHLLISTNPDFSAALVDQHLAPEVTTFDYQFTEAYETVYVKVIATGPYGQNEHDSMFHIDTAPPASSVALLPAVTYDSALSIAWSGADERSGLRWYHLQVRDGNRPDSAWEDWLVNTTKTAELFQGQTGHTYYFRVRAMDQLGNWEAWPAGEGDTFTLIDPSAAPPVPWWNTAYGYKRNLVVLNNDSDWMPPRFPVHIRFTATATPTAAEIYNASLAATKGADVRVVYANTTELDRFVQRFTPDQIDIWFPVQTAIGGGSTNSTDYQLYYGNANPGTPPANVNTVFLPPADANTMALWHFQEGSGNIVYDSSGRGHDGYFFNAGWSDGFLGRTGSFNGSNAYIEVANSADLNPGMITLEAWIYLNGYVGDHPMIFSKDYYWLKVDGDRRIWFGINADGGNRIVTSSSVLNMYEWYHVAGTYDGNGHLKIYLNGDENAHLDLSPLSILFNDLPFRIGRLSNVDPNVTQYFPGFIQNARVSNIARTDFSYARINVVPSVAAGILQTPPVVGNSDLIIQNFATYPATEGGVLVAAVVKNQGEVSTINGFFTDLYLDHLPGGSGDYAGSIRFWVNDPIAAGTTVTLTTVIQDPAALGVSAMSAAAGSEISGVLYAQTDSVGAIGEMDEANNIYTTGTDICLTTPDLYEDNDTLASAVTITPYQELAFNFYTPEDQDWLKFDALAGEDYVLQTFVYGTAADTYLYLYDTDGATLLAASDDFGGSLRSRLDWTAPADGTYYLLVKSWNPQTSGCGTSYGIILGGRALYLPMLTR